MLREKNYKKRKLIKEHFPKKFEDVQNILQKLKSKESVIINLTQLPDDLSQRMLDFVCGGVFALDGTVRLIDECEYILIPKGVKISSERKE